jgi:Tol biopolymer transport system component
MIGSSDSWPAIERLFREAIELSHAERVVLLARIGRTDPALRASLERLLTAHEEPDEFLDEPDQASVAALLGAEATGAAHPEWLGRYRVLRQLGRGGMGIVFLAEDPRLGRHVALKLLPYHVSADPRAERLLLDEARAACALDHPHIGTIYEVAQAEGGRPFIVMAYYEGVTLRERLAQGPVPPSEVVRLATQIADGLAAAHAKGVVHRDIKPENILITSDGRAKILDFGLALVGGNAPAGSSLARGTLAYVSPEQIRGEAGDARSDVWSLGIVFHELLTGKRPVTGDASTGLRSIANAGAAPLSASQMRELAAIVDRCLRQRPAERYETAGELLQELCASPAPQRRRVRALTVAGVTAGGGVLAILGWSAVHSEAPGLTVSNVRQVTRSTEPEMDPALSPDGAFLAYAVGWAGRRTLVVRDLRTGSHTALTREVPGSHYGPTWTAGSDSIVFHTTTPNRGWPGWSGYQATTSRIALQGGSALPFMRGRVWDIRAGRTLYTVTGSLMVRDGPETSARTVASSGLVLHSARFSPDGSRVVFVEGGSDVAAGGSAIGSVGPSGIRIVPASGGPVVRVTSDLHQNTSPVWLPDGRGLLFISNRDGPSDIYRVRLAPDGRPVGRTVRVSAGLEPQSISLSADGRVIAFSRFFVRRNVWAVQIPDSGSVSIASARPVTSGNQRAENHGVSPDGRFLYFDSNLEGNQDIFVAGIDGGEPRRLTRDPADDFHPDVSPDGRTVAFYSTRFGTRDIFLMDTAGGAVTRLTSDPTEEAHPAFSPDGNALCFEVRGGADQPYPVVAIMTRAHAGAPWSAPRRVATGWTPHWSPDGNHLVYEADSGIVIATRDGDETFLVARSWDGFAWPHWAADGTIYYLGVDDAGQDAVFAVSPDVRVPRLVIRLDDERFKVQYGLSVVGRTVFLSLTEYESDIWMMDIEPVPR